MTAPTVDLRNVSFAFGDHTIVEGVSLRVDAGELVALVGPNGSGKTTFLELVAGLRAPDAGEISRPDAERSVAYLSQSPAFRPGFTARETVAFYAGLVADGGDPVAHLERVGLGDAVDRRVEALSGGMTRLLGIAQVLVGDPPLVVLDEPTSGLDPEMADRIFETMADLTADGRALLVASHDLAAIERRADRVVLLASGGVAFDGSPDALLDRTGTDSLRNAFSALLAPADETPPPTAEVTDR